MDFLVHHLLQTTARRLPDKEALVHGDRRMTYREVRQEVAAIARGLEDAGCARGDRIGVFMRPSIPQALSILAISQAGGVFVPIHHSLFPDQVAHIVDNCAMKGLIAQSSLLERAEPSLQSGPSLEFVVLDEPPAISRLAVPSHSLEEFCALRDAGTREDTCIDMDLAAILYTSGSTGRPKGIMLSHANIVNGATIVSRYLGLRETDRILAALPFSFDAGLNQMTTAFQQGCTLILQDFVLAHEIATLLRDERATGLAGVPTLWSLMVQSRTFSSKQLPHLRYITNTGGSVPQSLLDKLRAALPDTRIVLMYGLTEAFRSTYLPPEELPRRPTSIGKAIPNTEILVLDDHGRRCKPGEVGELVHCGPTVAMGYWGNPAASEKVFRPHPFPLGEVNHQRVCYSGDLVRMDDEGFLYFVGRRDKQIKSSGFRISPTEVEATLLESGMLREAAVIGIPDEMLGQRIKAFVVGGGNDAVDLAELQDHCRSKMPGYMVPQLYEALDALPKTPNGKVDYEALRKRDRGR